MYPTNYRNSKYMFDTELMDVIDKVLMMDAGESLRLQLAGPAQLASMRYKIYAILGGIKRKADFIVKKTGDASLEVVSRPAKQLEVIEILEKREETERD